MLDNIRYYAPCNLPEHFFWKREWEEGSSACIDTGQSGRNGR